MSDITSSQHLETAFAYVCRQRLTDSPHSDIWDLRRHWVRIKSVTRQALLNGSYQLSPVFVVGTKNGHRLTRMYAIDAVVLKAIAMALTTPIQQHIDRRCHHIKGNGGLKGALTHVHGFVGRYRFAIKSDIADYYASMDHQIVLRLCRDIIADKRIINIIAQYLNRVEITHGEHTLIYQGIIKGCPLSPLMGAIMLKSLDRMVPKGCAYARYMDDWVILTKTRSQLRRVVKKMHRVVQDLKLKLALAKTFIGRINKGFDFLGYRINGQGICGLARQTVLNHRQKLRELYEQQATELRVQQYKKRWLQWVYAGLSDRVGNAIGAKMGLCALS